MIHTSLVLAILACVGVGSRRAPAAVCETIRGQRCQFPFTYRGKTYNECTYDNTENGRPWCAYETRRNGNAVPNKWEDCDTSVCYTATDRSDLNTCRTESGPDAGNTCKFPFKYNGKTHNSCTKYTWSGQDYGKSWCSTETDSYGNHVDGVGKYGFCGSSCPGYKPTTTTTQTSRNTCRTESGPDAGNSCKFPFKYNGKTHNSCTKYTWSGQDYGKSWCSTETDSYGNHVDGVGKYGFCGSSCPGYKHTPTITLTPRNTCRTESGPDAGNSCKFPFKYNGKTHNSCTKYTWSGQDYGKSWCSTETDSNGNHVDGVGKYGFCGSSCPGYKPTPTITQTPSYPKKECITLSRSSPVPNAKCVFPFRYNGQTYNSCTKFTATQQNYGKYWCSTNTDSYGNHKKGNYGFCGTGNGCF